MYIIAMAENVRLAAAAGGFYPAEPAVLAKMAEGFVSGGKRVPGEILALLVPHAGYVYSGATAGAGFSVLKNLDFETAVILGAGHRVAVSGAALSPAKFFSTPLGRVEVDSGFCAELKKSSPLFTDMAEAHEEEHSIEVQLPFLQSLGRKIKIVPVLLNMAEPRAAGEIGSALAKTLAGKKALIIISSDLSHYPPAETAGKIDLSVVRSLSAAARLGDAGYFSLSAEFLSARGEPGVDTVCCGQAAVLAGAVAAITLGADDFELIKYSNSGDVKGADKESVVGYAAGAFVKTGRKKEPLELSEKEKKLLLQIARRSVESGRPEKMPLSGFPVLNLPAAVFVTLHKRGALRGCIGSLEPEKSLQDAVAGCAVSSAFSDPRFEPVSPEELGQIDIEISVLSPLKKAGHEEIVPGKHGVVVKKGFRGGTYLPQVWEHFGTKERFLDSLCAEKAGLPAEAWREKGTELFIYTVGIIKEN